jgi:hypothetical protein
MKYILMMHTPRGTGDYENDNWSREEFAAHMKYMRRLNKELVDRGEMVGVEALSPPGRAKIVRAAKKDAAAVTDGPFPEAKEFLAGYWIVDVDRAERAYEIAAMASAAPGRGGKPLEMPIEVREVMRIEDPTGRNEK